MYLQNKLLAKKRCYEVALQAALQEWQREPVELKCPACGSKKLGINPAWTGKHPRFCTICRHAFDQPDNFVCDCPQPGNQSKCHDCPNFRKLMVIVKTKVEASQSPRSEC